MSKDTFMCKRIIFLFLTLVVGLAFATERISPSVIQKVNPALYLRYSVEGNFTDSGYNEILGFYQNKSSMINEGSEIYSIDKTYCFILNKDNEIIKQVEVPFATLQYNKIFNIDRMPLDQLGERIPFGAISDFNKNGHDELYLYSLSGIGIYPIFLEFKNDEFLQILNFQSQSTAMYIISVNPEGRCITFEGKGEEINKDIQFIWDDKEEQYLIK